MISLKEILDDNDKREMYLSGFSHGYANVTRLKPSFLKEVYDIAYDDGMNKKVDRFFSAMEAGMKNIERKVSITRS